MFFRLYISPFQREMDLRFGCSWHVVAGEEFGFDFDYEVKPITSHTLNIKNVIVPSRAAT